MDYRDIVECTMVYEVDILNRYLEAGWIIIRAYAISLEPSLPNNEDMQILIGRPRYVDG